MKKTTFMKNLFLFILFSFYIYSCSKEVDNSSSTSNSNKSTSEVTPSGGLSDNNSNIYNGSTQTGMYWQRNDGQGLAYLSLSGSTAKACVGNKETIGTFNSSKPSMTFIIGNDVLEFPLLFTDGVLYVGAPDQAVNTHNAQTLYVKTNTYACNSSSSGGTSTTAKGNVLIWSSVKEYGFKYGFNAMNVSVSGSNGTIYGGHYTSAPSCGSTYCFTKELNPGTYTVTGTIYPLKPLTGPTPPTYTISKTFTVYANQCTAVELK
jgi:hypothetical protein